MILKTERTLLVPWEEKYAERLYELAKDDRVGPVAGWPVHRDVENSREVIKNILSKEGTFAVILRGDSDYQRNDMGLGIDNSKCDLSDGNTFVFIEKDIIGSGGNVQGGDIDNGKCNVSDEQIGGFEEEDSDIIGSAGIVFGEDSNLNLPMWQGEIGYWLGFDYWGKGLMTEVVRDLIRFGFEDIGLNTIWCGYFEGNERSRRVQEKCGFTYHHTEKNMYWALMDEYRTEHVMRLTREENLRRG